MNHGDLVAAIVADALRRYKSFDEPRFDFVQEELEASPYDPVWSALYRLGYSLQDETNLNDDVSCHFEVAKGPESWSLLLSLVGPYGLVIGTASGAPVRLITHAGEATSEHEKVLLDVVSNAGLKILTKDIVEVPVPIKLFNTGPLDAKLFQVLFTDSEYLPWETSEQPGWRR